VLLRNNTLITLGAGLAALCASSVFAADTRSDSLEAVIVTAERVRETPATEATIQTEKLLDIPGSFGDPLQSIFALPGVLPSSEIGGAPAVRGSGPEDNDFLTDFLPTGYLFHAFGFSIFNENLIRDFGIKNAGFGARYGRATGAVFDVMLREPREEPWTTTLDGSFLRVGAMIEGALNDSQALYASARESTLHLLLKARRDTLAKDEDITFDRYPRARDLQAKYSWRIDDANRLSVLIVGAYDATGLNFGETADLALIDPGSAGDATFERRFVSEALNWHHDDGTNSLRTAIGHLQMSQDLRFGNLGEYSNNDSQRWTARTQFERALSLTHRIAAGAEYQYAEFEYATRLRYRSCSRFNPSCEFERGPMTAASDAIVMRSSAVFIEDRWQVAPAIGMTFGLRGEHDAYLDQTYVEPRIGAAWAVNGHWELRTLWGRYHQAPRVSERLPVYGNPELAAIEATHYVLGVTHRRDDLWSWNAEIYYKDLHDVVVDVPTEERYLNAATGKAYGLEFMINKNRAPYAPGSRDRFYGWFTLGLAKTERRNKLNGTTAAFDYDAPVVANLVLNYRWNPLWDAGLRWTYRSGMPYTPIVGNRENTDFPGYYLPVFGALNDARAAPYHRLDLRIERQFVGKRLRGSVYVDILNAYARQNGGAVRYKPVPNSSTYELEEEEALPLLPSIGVKLVF
jgi:hypothetical protein